MRFRGRVPLGVLVWAVLGCTAGETLHLGSKDDASDAGVPPGNGGVDAAAPQACEDDDDCADRDALPLCDTDLGQCVECLGPTDCDVDEDELCDPAGRCVDCMRDADCDLGESCHVPSGECRECSEDGDCDADEICVLPQGQCEDAMSEP